MRVFSELTQALRKLPGVGPRSAHRMAYHLLQYDRDGALELAQALAQALDSVQQCEQCNGLSESAICSTCADPERDHSHLCVVQSATDQAAIERSGGFNGLYFILAGALNPLDGVGPKEIGLDKLLERITQTQSNNNDNKAIAEVIVATGFTAQGEMTAHILREHLSTLGIRSTRLAKGVPAGSDLEFVDTSTLAHALAGRN